MGVIILNIGCTGIPAPNFGRQEGRSDVEGCCWWGRGVIQTTGVCNFGKLNYHLCARAAAEGRHALFPSIDFCANPSSICEPGSDPRLRWIAGFFYHMQTVQDYSQPDWDFKTQVKAFVNNNFEGDTLIDGVSGIVNRGCHNPPYCGTGELDGGPERRNNFIKVLTALHII